MNHDQTTATIIETSPRAADWQAIFGRTCDIPLKGSRPSVANRPGLGYAYVYKLDLLAITADERQCLIEHIVTRFSLLRDQVERDLDERGVPILAEDVLVSTPQDLAVSMLAGFEDEPDVDEWRRLLQR